MKMSKLNKKHKTGAINLLDVTGEDTGLLISPFHPEFKSQIEGGIWDIVYSLNSKGYYTVDSCQGHFIKDTDDYCHFTVVVFDKKIADFLKKFLSIKWVVDTKIERNWIDDTHEKYVVRYIMMASFENLYYINVKIIPKDFLFSKIIRKYLTPCIRVLILRKIKKLPHISLLECANNGI